MPKLILSLNKKSTAIVIATSLSAFSQAAIAQPIDRNSLDSSIVPKEETLSSQMPINSAILEPTDSLSQVTSVSQLSDVQPTDWAFTALQSLVERYGCIAGYPDGTYRGNRALTRYEFAAGLNACLDRVTELMNGSNSGSIGSEDLATLQRLQQEFSAELATLRGRVDSLEARTSELEANQFSTTTRLNGEVIFGLTGINGGKKADGSGQDVNDNIIFSDRVRLNFETSFTGRDLLTTRLEASNSPSLKVATGTDLGRLSFEESMNNDVQLSVLEYKFPIGDNILVGIAPLDEAYRLLDEDVEALSPLEDDGNGSISRFGRFAPIFRLGGEKTAGAVVAYEFNDAARLSLLYVGGGLSNDPSVGIFNGANVTLAHLTVQPIDRLALGLTYAHSYSVDGTEEQNPLDAGVGGENANNPFDGSPTTANSYSAEAAYRINSAATLSGWVGFSNARAVAGANHGATADLFNWAATLSFPDLGKTGSLGAIVVGQPSKATSNDIADREDLNTSLHLEAMYRYAVNDNVTITPGVIVITNPEHDNNNDTIYVGTIRTTFSF